MTERAAPFEERLKAQAYGVGFDLAGIAALGPMPTAPHYDEWLAAGYAGEMAFLTKRQRLRADSTRPVRGMRSALVVALDYGGRQPAGPFARYARGGDYHRLMWDRLDEVGTWLTAETGAKTRSFVDSGPVLERDLARQAGLGWFGKNTMLINPRLGSFFFLGALFTEAELAPDAPFADDRCGSCTRCLDACPTQAFVEPRVLDATRCISYLTIERRSDIPDRLQASIGEHLYGCDECQDVCPWNVRFATALKEPTFTASGLRAHADAGGVARALLAMSAEEYELEFGTSAVTRAPLERLQRNAAVVLRNTGGAP